MTSYKFLQGSGEMNLLTQSFDWSKTSLGPPDKWQQSLRTSVNIVLNSKIPMFLWWGENLIQFYNDAYRPSFGNNGKHPAALGQYGEECWPEIWHTIKPMIDRVIVKGENLLSDNQLIPIYRNGKLEDVYWKFSYSPVLNDEDMITGVLVVCEETTQTVEESIAKKELKYHTALLEAQNEAIPDAILIVDTKGNMLSFNHKFEALWKIPKEIIERKDDNAALQFAMTQLVDPEGFISRVNYCYAHLDEASHEEVIFTDGRIIERYGNIVRGEDGTNYGWAWYFRDITEVKKMAEVLKESEKNLLNVIHQAPVAMFILKGPDYVLEIANEQVFELWGKRSDDVLNKPIFEGIPEAKGQGFEEILNIVYYTGETYKAYSVPFTLSRNGKLETLFLDFVYEAFRESDGRISGIISVATDVTQQVSSRKKIEEAEARTRLAIDSAKLGTYEINFITNELKTSERFNAIWGETQSISQAEFAAYIHPEDKFIRQKAHQESVITGTIFYEVRIIWRDGSVHWIKVNGKVLNDDNGTANYLLGVIEDITEKKNTQQQKDNFIAMASHELKTPVTSIKAYGQILEQMLLRKGDIKEAAMMNKMDLQVDRLNHLITDLLNITKINSGRLEYNKSSFDFCKLVTDTAEELQRTTIKHTLIVNCPKSVNVVADKERIGQVITNFISNAIKYSPNSPAINITVKVGANEVTCCVQDFGIGINEESQGKVFEQFYRGNTEKHHTFQGLGLGLYISAEIIKRVGGKIWVKSAEGKGSEFYFALPINN